MPLTSMDVQNLGRGNRGKCFNRLRSRTLPYQIGLVNVAIGYKIEYKISIYPIVAFKSIMESNPNGEHIQK